MDEQHMSIIGTKRYREDTDDEVLLNKRPKLTQPEPDAALSVFQIAELVENIIKYSLKNPETIVHISRMSKMHYNLVHSGPMWLRFGFSDKLINKENICSSKLRFLLAQLRSEMYKEELKELQMRANIVQEVCDSSIPWPKSVNLEAEEIQQFNANYYLTDEAAIALLRIIEHTYIRYFSLCELVQWLEQDNEGYANIVGGTFDRICQFPSRQGTISRRVTLQYHCRSDEKPKVITDILSASHDSMHHGFQGLIQQFTLANPNKTLLFIYSHLDDCKKLVSFIKIECCGDLHSFIQKKFNSNFKNTLDYLCEVDLPVNFWEKLQFYSATCLNLGRYNYLFFDADEMFAEDVTLVDNLT